MSGVRRIVPLTVGWERLPKSYRRPGPRARAGPDPVAWPAFEAKIR
jgi:hypothetical protein